MLILWIRKSNTGKPNLRQENDEESFQEHKEDMKKFRLAHPEIEVISSKDVITTDKDILAAAPNIKLNKHAHN